MTDTFYEQLIRELCACEDLPDPRQIFEKGAMRIGGHDVHLMHDGLLDPDTVYLTVDFGALPEDAILLAYRAMLETNIMLAALGTGALALDPSTGHPVFASRIALTPELTGAQLADMLKQCVGHAQQWQLGLAALAGSH
jgi:hypothetical protein